MGLFRLFGLEWEGDSDACEQGPTKEVSRVPGKRPSLAARGWTKEWQACGAGAEYDCEGDRPPTVLTELTARRYGDGRERRVPCHSLAASRAGGPQHQPPFCRTLRNGSFPHTRCKWRGDGFEGRPMASTEPLASHVCESEAWARRANSLGQTRSLWLPGHRAPDRSRATVTWAVAESKLDSSGRRARPEVPARGPRLHAAGLRIP